MPERVRGKTLIAGDEGDDADGVVIKLYGEETNGAISIIEQPFEPGLLPPHLHQNDVWRHVLQGDARPGWRGGRQGDTGLLGAEAPPAPHTMRNPGPEPARILELYTPGGFELFFKDVGERLGRGPVGLDELNRLGEPQGIRVFDDWIPDLKAAHNLRVVGE
jgi:hypothetical protein